MNEEQHSPDTQQRIYLVIHGHFYQPPRENPWTLAIPQQDSASPYHDWNERITAECYQPNTRARVLDAEHRILSLENNFASLNFNIGPTLLLWLEQHHPNVYANIVQADRDSCQRRDGHGNAIAQVYNHVLMPLSNERDQMTQILWGMAEFRHRFGREPESVWLPETGINHATVKDLIDLGLKYVILSPTQAQGTRAIGGRAWTDVSGNSIDTTQPYRLYWREESTEDDDANEHADRQHDNMLTEDDTPPAPSIDVFFYDGNVSNDISFNHLLYDAGTFTRRIRDIAGGYSHPQVLIHVATDGEIYGHHEAHGDKALATALRQQLPEAGVEVTNYGHYLKRFPPTQEVQLKSGPDGEGTAWSCAHGVGRWYRDCGCHTGGPDGWNQEWRTPLRAAFDWLRDTVADVLEERGGELFHDPWQARDAYIRCILDPSAATVDAFLDEFASHALDDDERSLALRLLEAQKYVMFTYTSCAWFFNDLSGLEPVQNLRYAARVIQLVQDFFEDNLESLLCEMLDEAVSNLPECGTGKELYMKLIAPEVYTPERAVNQYALEDFIRAQRAGQPPFENGICPIHLYDVERRHVLKWHGESSLEGDETGLDAAAKRTSNKKSFAASTTDAALRDADIYSGLVHVVERSTRQAWDLVFTVFVEPNGQPVTYVKQMGEDEAWDNFVSALPRNGHDDSETIAAFWDDAGCTRYTLADLYAEDVEKLFGTMLHEYGQRIEQHIETVYADSLELLESLTAMNLRVPSHFQASVEFSLTYHAMIEMGKLYSREVGEYSPAQLQAAIAKVLRLSEQHHLTLDMRLLRQRLTEALTRYLVKLSRRFALLQQEQGDGLHDRALEEFVKLLQETLGLLEQAEKLDVAVDKSEIQNMTHDILESTVPRYLGKLQSALENAGQTESESAHQELHRFFREYRFMQTCLRLAKELNFNIDRYREHLISAELTMVQI